MGWNEAVFRWVNGWPESLTPIFYFFSESNKWTSIRILLLTVIVSMIVFGKNKGRKAALLTLIAWAIANEITDVLKAAVQELRPCVELQNVNLHGVHELTSYGTASAHSANMAAVATVMTYFLGRYGYIWIAVALLTGISRIYVGVHYPTQVLLGWTVGILVGLATVKVYEAISKRMKPDEEEVNTDEPEIA